MSKVMPRYGQQPGQIKELPPLKTLIGRNWVTLAQCAELIGVTYQTVLRYVIREPRKIAAVKHGGQWRIYEDELRRFLAEGNLPVYTDDDQEEGEAPE